jgi:hypothetical protein
MLVVVLEAQLVRVLVVVRFVAVGVPVRHVFVFVTGVRVRMAGSTMLVLVMVRCIVLMFIGHRFISISLSLVVGPSVATWSIWRSASAMRAATCESKSP